MLGDRQKERWQGYQPPSLPCALLTRSFKFAKELSLNSFLRDTGFYLRGPGRGDVSLLVPVFSLGISFSSVVRESGDLALALPSASASCQWPRFPSIVFLSVSHSSGIMRPFSYKTFKR